MKYLFQGKRGGLIAFLLIATLVAGGLGWVTVDALRLEREQRQARAEADFSNRLRLALWRLDSQILSHFAEEANRPYHQYTAREAADLADQKEAHPANAIAVVELVPEPGVDSPAWMPRHFLLGAHAVWRSPQALRDSLVRHFSVAQPKPAGAPQKDAKPVPFQLANERALQQLLSRVQSQDSQAGASQAGNLTENSTSKPNNNDDSNYLRQQESGRNYSNLNQTQSQKPDKDAELRAGIRAKSSKGMEAPVQVVGPPADPARNRGDKPVLAILGPMIPLWLKDNGTDTLVIARLVQVGPKMACQVTLVDWPALESVLREQVSDLFPEARFKPTQEEEGSERPERAMTALPVELVPAVEEAAPARRGWTPVRVGLALAWTAALVALVAVALGGWSLLDLSERRIRFVSAVTHELRTPLTTLRLYLDMLTGGLVKEERQKEEYLQTLHAEADRLHRLISNVLDFSRLENQRPRLEKTNVALCDILEQVRLTWAERCAAAGKELVIENGEGSDATLFTDVQLVQQIVGNLVDNACKYSRDATDRRIWARASKDGQRLIAVEVEDRGPGVPLGERRSIFRPFRRGHGAEMTAGGVGLGLALAHRWAGLLGGRLTLCRNPSRQGACFRLELPCSVTQ